MEYSFEKKVERSIFVGSIILVAQSVLVALRVNGNITSHWALTLIPTFFLLFLWGSYVFLITWNRIWNEGLSHSPLMLMYLWNGFVWLVVFFALFSVEQSNPGKIGVLGTTSPLIVLFGMNILTYVFYEQLYESLLGNFAPTTGAKFAIYESEAHHSTDAVFSDTSGQSTTMGHAYDTEDEDV